MTRGVVALVVASAFFFAIGVVVGREWGSGAESVSPPQAGEHVVESTAEGARAGVRVGRPAPTPVGRARRAVPVAPAVPEVPVEKMQVEQLREELADARQALARFRAERAAEIGTPVAFPEDLPEVFSQKEMLQRFNDAFEFAGIDADVTVADCSEYPCLLCGDIGRDEGEPRVDDHLQAMHKAAKSPSLAPYKGAEKHGSVMTRKEEEDGKVLHTTRFCQAMYPDPEDAELADAIARRLKYRVQQLEEGL